MKTKLKFGKVDLSIGELFTEVDKIKKSHPRYDKFRGKSSYTEAYDDDDSLLVAFLGDAFRSKYSAVEKGDFDWQGDDAECDLAVVASWWISKFCKQDPAIIARYLKTDQHTRQWYAQRFQSTKKPKQAKQ